MSVRAPSAMCFSLACLPGDLWLTALNLTDEHPDGPAVLVDVYDREGVLRYTQRRAQVGFGAYCADNEGRVYVAEVREELPVVVRYRLELE